MKERAEKLGEMLAAQKLTVCTAESCTGGGIANLFTTIPGSSVWFDRAYVTYSNQAKISMLGVDPDTLKQYGAVSEQVAQEMALGALRHSGTNMAVSVTGVAGPGGGTAADFDWASIIKLAWQKKFSGPPEDYQEKAKQARFLEYRGFSADSIMRFLAEL